MENITTGISYKIIVLYSLCANLGGMVMDFFFLHRLLTLPSPDMIGMSGYDFVTVWVCALLIFFVLVFIKYNNTPVWTVQKARLFKEGLFCLILTFPVALVIFGVLIFFFQAMRIWPFTPPAHVPPPRLSR